MSLDRINTLPESIIEYILTLMPIRYALRTSILSKKWRYSWRGMPKLVFTNNMVKVQSCYARYRKSLLVNAIFHVLLLHNGPIRLQLGHSFLIFQMDSEFDQIISYLSKGDSVKELSFIIHTGFYQLPVSFFSLQGLESLKLQRCVFEPPLTFNGFSRLMQVTFRNVKVSAQMLQRFLSKCPLIDFICLVSDEEAGIDFAKGGHKFTFVDLFQCVPLINLFCVSKYYMKHLSAGGMPHKLPALLVHLENLHLDVCLIEPDEISSALCIIRSSPKLKIMVIKMHDNEKLPVQQQTPTNFLDQKDYSDLKLDHLEKFKIYTFSNSPLEMEFVKLIMAKSPVLEKVRIKLSGRFSSDEELKMLRHLVRFPFPRASPSANLIIERPKTS